MKMTRFFWPGLRWLAFVVALLLLAGVGGTATAAESADRAAAFSSNAGGSLSVTAVVPTPSADRVAAEKAIRSYAQQHGVDMTGGSRSYTEYMKSILMGEYPGLNKLAARGAINEYAFDVLDLGTLPTPTPIPTIAPKAMEALTTTYDPTAAVRYAFAYAITYNPAYPAFANDCTNFASQVAKAGTIPTQSTGTCCVEDTTAKWYVTPAVPGCSNQQGCANMTNWAWSTSWSDVASFRLYMVSHIYAEQPQFYENTGARVQDLIRDMRPGDFVQIDELLCPTPDPCNWHPIHTTIAVANNGTEANTYLTSHSGPETDATYGSLYGPTMSIADWRNFWASKNWIQTRRFVLLKMLAGQATPGPTNTRLPTATPQPTSPPAQQGVTILSAWPQGATLAAGQTFNPDVVVQTTGFSLNCGQDYLENRDGNRYGTNTIQGCQALGNNQYRIHFNQAMQAPSAAGDYHSQWQVWHYPNYVGPQIDLWFRIAAPTPDPNRPPSTPSLNSPGDWSDIHSDTAPTLCWNAASDPDGNPLQYWAEIYQSAVLDNSGWISGTCWHPTHLDHQFFGYQWRVQARDSHGAVSSWSPTWHFNLSPPPYNPPHPVATPPALPTLPVVSAPWWDAQYPYRRPLTITTDRTLPTGMLMVANQSDLAPLVAQGKVRADFADVRVVRQVGDTGWQEVARRVWSATDVEFFLAAPIDHPTDTSYYLYYGNPTAGTDPTFNLSEGFWVAHYLDKGGTAFHSIWEQDRPIDFNDMCGPPIDHRGHTGSAFDDSDEYTGRIFIPTSGQWTFQEYTNDGWALTIDDTEIGRFDGYQGNQWNTVGSMTLPAGWHTFRLPDMWVNCGALRLAMAGPNFANQIVPAAYFQRWFGNMKTGVPWGAEAHYTNATVTPTAPPTGTSTPGPPTATPPPLPPFARYGTGQDGSLTISTGQTGVINQVAAPVNAQGQTAAPSNSTGFAVYDTVLFHQTVGTANMGRWEYNRIAAILSPTNWTLATPLTYAYTSSGGQAQVIRVPQYQTVLIQAGGRLTAPPWNAALGTGGILVFQATGNCTVTGALDMTAQGFRGGIADGTSQYGETGESGNGAPLHQDPANGSGGGAGFQTAEGGPGGGGGGNGTAGGTGAAGGYAGRPAGQGGAALGTSNLNLLPLGGGGGAGARAYSNPGGTGGRGGGLVIVSAPALNVSSGTISVTGASGQAGSYMSPPPENHPGYSGGAGGGAAGTVLLTGNTMDVGTNRVTALGGSGGSAGGGSAGAGGGGGTGPIHIVLCGALAGGTNPAANVQQMTCLPSATATPPLTPTLTVTPSATNTPTLPATPSLTPIPSYTATPTFTRSSTPTPTATQPPTPPPTVTSVPTATPGTGRSAYSLLEAESFSSQSGIWLEGCSDTGGGQDAAGIANGDYLGFTNVDFGAPGPITVRARVASGAASGVSGVLEFWVDELTPAGGTKLGELAVTNTGGWQSWQTLAGNVTTPIGWHTVYVKFTSGQSSDFVNLNWFQFVTAGGATNTPIPTPAATATSGTGRSAYSPIEAESFSSQSGTWLEGCSDTGGGQDVAGITNSDYLGFTNVDFGTPGLLTVQARVASGAGAGFSGVLEFWVDELTPAGGTKLGELAVTNTGGWQSWQTLAGSVTAPIGRRTVYVKFTSSQPNDFVNLNWFQFVTQ